MKNSGGNFPKKGALFFVMAKRRNDSTTIRQTDEVRVVITAKEHPHYGKSGVATGKVISLFGNAMAEVRFEDGDGCFVSKGQITRIP